MDSVCGGTDVAWLWFFPRSAEFGVVCRGMLARSLQTRLVLSQRELQAAKESEASTRQQLEDVRRAAAEHQADLEVRHAKAWNSNTTVLHCTHDAAWACLHR